MRRILVLANRTCPCPALHAYVHEQLDERPGEVEVVAPALNSRLRHWFSDTDDAQDAAQARVELAVEGLRAEGIEVAGAVGDAHPLLAIEDALATFDADAVVLSTFPEGESHWLEEGLLEEAAERLSIPVMHFTSEYGLVQNEPPGQGTPA